MNPKKLVLIAAALGLPLIATAIAGAATNLVTNGAFDSDASGWAAGAGQPVTIAHNGGHLEVTNHSTFNGETRHAAVQCVAVVPAGSEYQLKADVLVPSGQAVEGSAQLAIIWFATNDCSGNSLLGHLSVLNSKKDAWQTIYVTDGNNANAQSASLWLISRKPAPGDPPGTPHTAWFDNVSFKKVEPPPAGPVVNVPIAPEVPQGPFDIFIPGPLGQAPKTQPTVVPSGPSNPDPQQPQQPQQPEQPQQPRSEEPSVDVPTAEPDAPAAVAGVTPLPPSTGTGVASRQGSPLIAIAAALIAAASATFAFATRRAS